MTTAGRISPATLAMTAALVTLPLWQLVPVDFDRSAVLTFLPALWFGRVALGEAWRRPRSPWLVVWLAVALVLSIVLSPHPAPATTMAANWILLGAVGLLARGLIAHDPGDSRRLLGALAGGGLLGTVVAMGVWWLQGGGLVPLYAHHRIFGLHLIGAAVASAALLAIAPSSRRTRITWLAAGGIVWAGLLWSGGRAPVLAVLATLGAWIAIAESTLRRRLLLTVGLLLSAGLVLSALLWTDQPELGWWHAWHRTADVTHGEMSLAEFTSTRSDFWRAALAHAREAPWFGRGPDAYRYLTPKLDGQQPHNFVLQLLLDLGVFGAVPALLFLSRPLWHGSREAVAARGDNAGAPWLAVAVASAMAGLLDGVFYHALALIGFVIGAGAAARAPTGTAQAGRRWGGAILALALAFLAVHAVEFHLLARAAPPETSQAWRTRLVRAWPSTTLGLPRWLEHWRTAEPGPTLAWATWAQDHSPNPNTFHLYAAQLFLEKGDRPAAERELRAALAKAHWSLQPDLRALLRSLGFSDLPQPP